MASKVAPPKSTGGGGFVFEDKACAWFLAHMLSDEPPNGTALGRIEQINFQTRPDGWLLDDLLLTLIANDGEHRCAFSVKSNVQFNDSGAPRDFVRVAWEQFLHEGSTRFDETKDYMGLVTASLPTDTRDALAFVIRTARDGDPKTLPGRYAQAGWAREARRTLFDSFSCPADLATSHGVSNEDTGRILGRLQFHHFDFEQAVSESEKDGVERCRRALRSGGAEEAAQLWEHLLYVSAERRPTAGSISRRSLLDDVRHRFRLTARPNHREDWDRLRTLTAASTASLSDSIGSTVRLPRDADVEKLEAAVNADHEEARGIVLLGPSGSGKTAITKRYVEQLLANDVNCLWFEARSFERADFAVFQADLALTHTLRELLPLVPDARAALVLDGLDRLYDEGAFALVASLLNAVDPGRQGSPWRPVVTCQTQEWPRLRESLLRAGIPAAAWREMECKPIPIKELKPVWDGLPSTARLQYQENLRPLLANLKILDLIATRIAAGSDVQTGTWVGESNVATWYWESVIARGTDGPPRARFVSLLAERQADMLRPAVPMHDLGVSDLGPLTGLTRDRVCRQTPEDQILFEHDLFGDWARLRVLLSHGDGDLVDFVRSRIDSPLWHRAIRLYGAYLLEHAKDVEKWRNLISALSAEKEGGAGDLLLESTIFAANPRPLLEQTKTDLLKDEGRLLGRLLGRFLAFATLPDPRYAALARAEGWDAGSVEAHHRYPNWPYWPAVLRFLHDHRDECVQASPVQIGRVVEMWLNYAPEGRPFRQEAADIGLMLGQQAMRADRSYSRPARDHRRLYYRAALGGARERPDEVVAFALNACQRSQVATEDNGEQDDDDLPPRFLLSDPRFDPNEPVPEPWPDGPRSRVDEDFQHVVLESAALQPLMRARPAAAVEVILAVLIRPRRRFEWTDDHWHVRTQLGLEGGLRWHPPLYIDGPFLPFLIADFNSGLDVITRLVGFTTERWRDYAQIDSQQHETEQSSQRDEEEPLGRMAREWHRPPGAVLIQLEEGQQELPGDARVYGWPAGLGNPPSAVEAALMALEQYLYMELDQGRPINEKARAVLERASSVAFLKILCDVGRRERSLFEGPLRPVLAVPEVYYWDIQAIVQGRSHLMIGAVMRGEWFARMAQQFHDLKHRTTDLRHVTVELLLGRPAMREFFEETRVRWEEQAEQQDGPFKDFLRRLVIVSDIRNYRIQNHPENG